VVAVALLLVALRRRDVMALTLFGCLLVNVVATVAIAVASQSAHIFELRFNTRAMPLALVGVGWLYRTASNRRGRLVVWGATAALLLATLPLTWHTMGTYRYRLDEKAFVDAIRTGQDQSRNVPGVDPAADRAMARFILGHVPRRSNTILTDDAQTFGVILFTGRPALFLDRIDHGDGRWLEAAAQPRGRVRYLLLSSIDSDLLRRAYPHVYGSETGKGLRLVHRTRTSKLFEIVGPTR
jgi:hypothetical protein